MAKNGFTIRNYLARSSAIASSQATYERQLGQIEGWLGKPLASASLRDLERLKTKLREMPSGPQYVRLARMFYRAAGRAEFLPILRLKQRLKKLSPEDILTPSEVQGLIAACDSARDKALIGALWDTGARIHEILAVPLRDVVVDPEGRYRIFFRKTKTAGEEHSGYVLDTAPVLRAWLAAHPWLADKDAPLFPAYTGKFMTRNGGYHVVAGAARRAKVTKRVYPHLFRHSRATHLLRLGMSESQVKRLLGWVPGSTMLARYSHLTDGDAYRGLLKAQGYDVPEIADAERMTFEDTDLKPVVPMVAPPGAVQVVTQVQGVDMQEVVEAIRRDLAERPPPAWSTPAEYGKAISEVHRIRDELRRELQAIRQRKSG